MKINVRFTAWLLRPILRLLLRWSLAHWWLAVAIAIIVVIKTITIVTIAIIVVVKTIVVVIRRVMV